MSQTAPHDAPPQDGDLEASLANALFNIAFKIPKSDCPFLDALPTEIRCKIYAFHLPSIEYQITLIQPITKRQPSFQLFKSLLLTCKSTEKEVRDWYKSFKELYDFTETVQFGPINLDHTLFTITVSPICSRGCDCIDPYDPRPNPVLGAFPGHCGSDCCTYKILNRMGLFNPELETANPLRTIRHLRISLLFEEQSSIRWMPAISPHASVISIVKRLSHLQELDVFLHWGLFGDEFQRFWDVYAGPDVESAMIPTGRDRVRVFNNEWPSDMSCQITVWHGPRNQDADDHTGFQKLRRWRSRKGEFEIFPVKDPESDEIVVWSKPEPDLRGAFFSA